MKKKLRAGKPDLYYYKNGEKRIVTNSSLLLSGLSGDCSRLFGNCSGLFGNCSDLSGDCSGLFGNCSGLSGDCSGLFGNCSRLSGDLDDCEITSEERKEGVNLRNLIIQEEDEIKDD